MKGAFEWLLGRFSVDLGIDLGTANTLVCMEGEGIVLTEPSVVAVQKGTNRVLLNGNAVGETAKVMLGKTPGTIEAVRPLRDGVIADFEIAEAMLRYFIQRVHKRKLGVRPRVVVAIPSGITAVERRAVINSAERAGARRVFLIDEPLAAGIGAGLPITDPTGSMIVDIGVRVAGDELDDAIIQHLRKNYNLLIGELTAERIKLAAGSAAPLEEEFQIEVKGRDMVAGLPRKTLISTEEVREALREPIDSIVGAIKTTLEKTQPELAGDIVERGITLAGGGALLKGLDRRIQEEIQLPVAIAEDPLTCVARGTGAILQHIGLLRAILAVTDED